MATGKSIVQRDDVYDIKTIDNVKNPWKWSWMEKEVNGKAVGLSIRKLRQPGKAFCIVCEKDITYGTRGWKAFEQHMAQKKHKDIIKVREQNQSLSGAFGIPRPSGSSKTGNDAPYGVHPMFKKCIVKQPLPVPLTPMVDRILNAEATVLGFVAENSLPFSVTPKIIELSKTLAKDAKALNSLSMNRTTASYKTRFGIAKTMHESVTDMMKKTPFSLNLDESTSNSNEKVLTILSSYYSQEQKQVVVQHFASVSVIRVNSESLVNELSNLFNSDEIPWSNVVSMLMDSCNVMRGSKSGVEKRIREDLAPHLLDIDGDTCHHAHNAAKAFCKQFDNHVEFMFNDFFSDFKWSTDLREYMSEICLILGVAFNMPEKYVSHRWLSVYDAALDSLRLLDAYTIFYYSYSKDGTKYLQLIIEIYHRLQLSEKSRNRLLEIRKNIKDKKLTTDGQLRKDRNVSRLFEERKLTKFVLGLYTSVLPLLKQYVLMFEMKEPKIHLLHEEQVKLFTEFLQCFMRPEVLADNCSPKKLKTVDVSNLPFILPEKDLFIGSKAGTMLQLMKPDQKKKILSQLFLSQCGLNLPTHDLTVAKNNNSTNNKSKYTSEEAVMELSSDEDEIIDSFPEEDIFVPESESTSSRRTATLMPEAFADDSEALEHFTREFSERYGDTHPVFYIGSLDDAIKESLQVRARDRKLLAIYLHHDSSIFSNVFCSQILCSEVIVNYLTTNFITWGWDLTHEANTSRLLTSATRHFGSVAGTQMRNYKTEELPALLIISRSRATNEIVDVIQGHVTLDELMTRMIHSVQIFQEQQSADIAEEQERAGRELIKQQQDAAYEESLAADRAKAEIQREEEAQRQAILEVEIEKQREVERLQQEEEHAKKTIQQNISEQLAPEPPKDAAYPISNIRFRVQGEVITRRFRADDTIQTLLNFLITKGFHTEEYKVLTTFPRRDITQLDQSQTLQDVKLYPQETLILEEKS